MAVRLVRIIAGSAKGRRLSSPRGSATRPMTDRAREAVFASLAGFVVDSRVLDLYAGTGSLGLEALSRGASEAVFVETDRDALASLRANVDTVGLGGDVVQRSVERYLATSDSTYDLVFVDPPFALEGAIVIEVLAAARGRLRAGGKVILHRRHGEEAPAIDGLELEHRRRYGDSEVFRYREAIGDDSTLSGQL